MDSVIHFIEFWPGLKHPTGRVTVKRMEFILSDSFSELDLNLLLLLFHLEVQAHLRIVPDDVLVGTPRCLVFKGNMVVTLAFQFALYCVLPLVLA